MSVTASHVRVTGGRAGVIGVKSIENGKGRRSMDNMKSKRGRKTVRDATYLEGQVLIAMPTMGDDNFARTVIYICAHSDEGAMGIILNRPALDLRFPELLVQLDIIGEDDAIRLPAATGEVNVLKGGPVESGRGFVLHSPDYFIDDSTLPIADDVCLTVTIDILRAMAKGNGPQQAVLALGYAGWAAGQLEAEIQENGWLTCPADPALIFDRGIETKYERALRKLGVDPAMLSGEAGHA